jgi:endoglucanase
MTALKLTLGTCAVMITACIPIDGTGGGATPQAASDPKAVAPCPADGVIDDGEDNNHQSAPNKGRGGYWFTFLDQAGSTITPTAGRMGGTFSMSPGGASGSSFAARVSGKIGAGDVVFAGAGVNFVDPKGAYDVSPYGGISFMAKSAAGPIKVRLKLPDANTDPDGKVCSECFNDFGADIEVPATWTKFTLAFSDMSQLPGWGTPRPAGLEKAKVYGIQWQVNTPGAAYDLWIDDVQFTGCQ